MSRMCFEKCQWFGFENGCMHKMQAKVEPNSTITIAQKCCQSQATRYRIHGYRAMRALWHTIMHDVRRESCEMLVKKNEIWQLFHFCFDRSVAGVLGCRRREKNNFSVAFEEKWTFSVKFWNRHPELNSMVRTLSRVRIRFRAKLYKNTPSHTAIRHTLRAHVSVVLLGSIYSATAAAAAAPIRRCVSVLCIQIRCCVCTSGTILVGARDSFIPHGT